MTSGGARSWTYRLAAATFICAVTLLPVTAASAHSELVESTPADGAELRQAPTQVELVFNDAIQQQGGDIVVSVRDTTVSDATTFAADGTAATVQLIGPAQPGSYTVKYRIVSADGHIASGTLGYSVTGVPVASSSSTGSPVEGTNTSGGTGTGDGASGTVIWVLGLGAIGIALVAAVISVAVRGRRDRSD